MFSHKEQEKQEMGMDSRVERVEGGGVNSRVDRVERVEFGEGEVSCWSLVVGA